MIREPKYFFDSGIRFECTQCGKCCTGAPGVVRVTDGEISSIAAHLEIPRDEFARDCLRPVENSDGLEPRSDAKFSLTERPDGSCIFFAEGKCRVYSARPAQCRTYPFWLKNLRTEEAWRRAERDCPGIGQGPLRDREEILRTIAESPV